jgi:DNA-binding NtrC family response regulator
MPFELIAAYGDRALEESAAKLGAYAVLHKPITPDVFLDVAKRALVKRRRPVTPGNATRRSLLQDAKPHETETKDWTFLD